MERFYSPFSSEIYFSNEHKVEDHDLIRHFVINVYNQSPNKDGGNFYGNGLTTYFYDDFTSNLDKVDIFKKLSNTVIEQSKQYLINRAHQIVQQNGPIDFEKTIRMLIEKRGLQITKMWFNVNPYGGYQGRHHHADNLLGGTYYVQTPNNSGKISFANPNMFSYFKNQSQLVDHFMMTGFDFITHEGDLLIWPGWMDHEIGMNHNKDEPRITISWAVNWGNDVQDI